MKMQIILMTLQSVLAFFNICGLLYVFYKFSRRPHDTLEARLINVENKIKDIEFDLSKDNDKIKEHDETNVVILNSVLALIEFEMNYCISENKPVSKGLEQAKENLQRYLASK